MDTLKGGWVSMECISDAPTGSRMAWSPSSVRCVARDGRREILQDPEIADYSRSKIDASVAELEE